MATLTAGPYNDDVSTVLVVGNREVNGVTYIEPPVEVLTVGKKSLFSVSSALTGQLWPRGSNA